MNKGYTYINGKVIISDENGRHKEKDYYDNIDSVLVQENVIEKIEANIKELKEKKPKKVAKRFIPFSFIVCTITTLTFPTLLYYLFYEVNPFTITIGTIYGTMPINVLLTGVLSLFGIPMGLIASISEYNMYKKDVNTNKAIISELEYLNEKLISEKECLLKLENSRISSKKDTETVSKLVDDKEELKKLKEELELYRDLGYNEDKYFSYYQKGKIYDRLSHMYDANEIEEAVRYFEKKEAVLIKKKNKKIRH